MVKYPFYQNNRLTIEIYPTNGKYELNHRIITAKVPRRAKCGDTIHLLSTAWGMLMLEVR